MVNTETIQLLLNAPVMRTAAASPLPSVAQLVAKPAADRFQGAAAETERPSSHMPTWLQEQPATDEGRHTADPKPTLWALPDPRPTTSSRGTPASHSDAVQDINTDRQLPRQRLREVAQDPEVRVLGLGDLERNRLRSIARDMMGDFRKAGFTHLALEMTPEHLAQYLRTGDRKSLPQPLRDGDYVAMLEAARGVQLILVAVDANSGRDADMARSVAAVLREHPDRRVLLVAGADRLTRRPGSLASLLRNAGVNIHTVLTEDALGIPMQRYLGLASGMHVGAPFTTRQDWDTIVR